MDDCELLEMLLAMAERRGDQKPLAKRLIAQFGSYANVLSAPIRQLLAFPGVYRHTVSALKVMHEGAVRLARWKVIGQPVSENFQHLISYLYIVMSRERVEQFRILFLDAQTCLIKEELHSKGTLNHTPVYIRGVVERALQVQAAGMIICHNHPSGDPTPSLQDVQLTDSLRRVLRDLKMRLYGHIIIGNGKFVSLDDYN